MNSPTLPFYHSYWVAPGKFMAGYYPSSEDPEERQKKLKALLRCGIRCVINLMEENEENYFGRRFIPYEEQLEQLAAEMGVEASCLRIPIEDMNVPTRDTMRRILDAIDSVIERGCPVYVHCLGGRGRTGTVVGCYLARHGVASGQEVLEKIMELRRKTDPAVSQPSPETHLQRSMVSSWSFGE
jgi:protein-tyrosine phosphatase